MKTYITLLRGVNVGGHKKVPMAQLRTLLAKSGLKNIKTYIQSGNVIFQSSIKDSKKLEHNIQKSILDHFGFEVFVIVKTRLHLKAIFNTCPFSEEKKKDSYFAILSDTPNKDLIIEVSKKTYENEAYKIIDDCLYFYCANGYREAKFNLNFFERKLCVNATARNYKTMVKLLSMSNY